jgi:hypothetical protein
VVRTHAAEFERGVHPDLFLRKRMQPDLDPASDHERIVFDRRQPWPVVGCILQPRNRALRRTHFCRDLLLRKSGADARSDEFP